MPKLTLDHDQRNALMRHLDRVSMPQLVWREPPSHTRRAGGVVQLLAGGRRLPTASSGRSVDHAQHRADWELATDLQPRIELLPRPTIHADLAALAALPAPDEDGAARSVQIALLERERFADSQASPPKQNNQRAKPVALGAITDRAHDRHDLFNRRWISRVLLALVAWRTASVVTGHGRRRTAVTCDVQQHGFHESSLGGVDDAAIRIMRPGAQAGAHGYPARTLGGRALGERGPLRRQARPDSKAGPDRDDRVARGMHKRGHLPGRAGDERRYHAIAAASA
jgi:hypothetical protein